jgi:hypothetical protein
MGCSTNVDAVVDCYSRLEGIVSKPLKRFLKIEPNSNPKLKLGENETIARGSKVYRTIKAFKPKRRNK